MLSSQDKLRLLFQTARDLREIEDRIDHDPVEDPQFNQLQTLQYYMEAGLEKLRVDEEVLALMRQVEIQEALPV